MSHKGKYYDYGYDNADTMESVAAELVSALFQ